jgi:O-antigen/teichoic acid export membrane protein
MSNTRQIAHNTIVQVVARVITTVLSFVAIGYLSRYLGVTGYGDYTLIFAYLSLFGVVVDFGSFLLQVRETTKHPEREAEILGNILGLKLALSLVVFVVAYLVSLFLYSGNPTIIAGIAVGTLSQTALALVNVPVSLFQARLKMEYVAVANVLFRALYLGAILWGVASNVSLIGLVALIAGVNVVSFFAQHFMMSKFVVVWPRWDVIYWWKFVKEAFPLGAATVLAMIYFHIDTVLLSVLQGSYEVGIYGSAYKIVEVILTVPTIFMSSVFPVLTRALSDDRDRAITIFRKAFDFSSILALPIAFGAMAVATPLMTFVFGPDFAPSGQVLSWLIWTTTISFFGAVLNYTIIAHGSQRLLLQPYLWATILNVVANWFIIPRYSYMGAAAVTVVTEIFVAVWVFILVLRRLGFVPRLAVFAKALISAAAMYAVIVLVDHPNVFASIGIGVAVYSILVLATRAVSRDIYKEVFRLR